ncbi:MAG: ribosomal protein, partial [Segetibacter sp.]|nr:ribosomal protein [Segetibacter sp.]
MPTFAVPNKKTPRDLFMAENEIINPNADAQETATVAEQAADATTATTNLPVGEATEEVETQAQAPQATEAPKAETAVEAPEAKAKPEPRVETPHDDFDWSIDKRNVSTYNKEEREKYDSVYDNTFVQINDAEIITGNVVGLTKTDVVINIGFKSDGLISLNEFRDLPNLKVGDDVEVMVVEKEDRAGHLHLSRKSARIYRAWERIVEVHKTGEVITGTVTSKTKGGLIVDVFGMETFLPGSQIYVKPFTDYDQFVGKTMEFKVVKVNEAIKNAVVSHKALI